MNPQRIAQQLAAKHGTAYAKRKVWHRTQAATARLQLAEMSDRPMTAAMYAWGPVVFWKNVYNFLCQQETVA